MSFEQTQEGFDFESIMGQIYQEESDGNPSEESQETAFKHYGSTSSIGSLGLYCVDESPSSPPKTSQFAPFPGVKYSSVVGHLDHIDTEIPLSDDYLKWHGSNFELISPVSCRDDGNDEEYDDDVEFDGSKYTKTRRSRARLNFRLEKLRRVLPPLDMRSSRKESKSNLIERATNYIIYLRGQCRQ
eukprot:jgi/Galph1/3862/GphlegSOOS_G2537.1